MSFAKRGKENWILLVILLCAAVLRFFHLGLESFWLDELFVANECDPHQTLGSLFDALRHIDQHPPLFYLAERSFFFFFGESEVTARILPAAAGVVAVYAMYLLGKQLVNKRLGLVVAALAAVNHFLIWYSREARGYMFTFLFATLSLVYFFRLIDTARRKDLVLYIVFSLSAMYSHYFGVLFVFSEFCAAGAFIVFQSEQPSRIKHLKNFGLAAGVLLVGYAVWIPVLLSFGKLTSFWIQALPADWLFIFFHNYFGDTPDLIHIMAILLVVYVLGAFARRNWKWPVTNRSNLHRSLLVLGMIALLCYGIPYVRGLMVTPMLQDRYTIVVLPGILLAIGWAIEMLPFAWLRYGLLAYLLVFSVQREGWYLKSYSKHYKTQFREVSAFIARDTTKNSYPVLNGRIGWFEMYYLKKFNYRGTIPDAPVSASIDSLVNGRSSVWKTRGFWLMNGHGAGEPGSGLNIDSATQRKIDSNFHKVSEGRFFDAWAQLYERK